MYFNITTFPTATTTDSFECLMFDSIQVLFSFNLLIIPMKKVTIIVLKNWVKKLRFQGVSTDLSDWVQSLP